jgi:hypothetical protein
MKGWAIGWTSRGSVGWKGRGLWRGMERGLACRNRGWTWGFVAILLCIYIRGMIRNVIWRSDVVVPSMSGYALGRVARPEAAFRTLFVRTTIPGVRVHISLSVIGRLSGWRLPFAKGYEYTLALYKALWTEMLSSYL